MSKCYITISCITLISLLTSTCFCQISRLSESISQCPRLKVLRLEENCLDVSAFTPKVLKESKIALFSIEGNVFDMKTFHNLEGYEEVWFEFAHLHAFKRDTLIFFSSSIRCARFYSLPVIVSSNYIVFEKKNICKFHSISRGHAVLQKLTEDFVLQYMERYTETKKKFN